MVHDVRGSWGAHGDKGIGKGKIAAEKGLPRC